MRSGLEFLAGADAGSLPDAELVDCLKGLELAAAAQTAARARLLTAFNARGVFEDDGARSPRSWLVWHTRTTKAAAGAAIAWMRRLAVHPQIAAALAAAAVSESWARQLCDWSDLLPPDVRDDADTIFLGAAATGVDLAGLSALAEQMYARTASPDTDDPAGEEFTERSLRLDLHWRGHGRLTGQLTPECAAALSAVLDSLGKKVGPEDTRTRTQRDHDALEEACRRLIAGGLPDAAGQPTQILLHMTLSQLRDLARNTAGGGNGTGAGQPSARQASDDPTRTDQTRTDPASEDQASDGPPLQGEPVEGQAADGQAAEGQAAECGPAGPLADDVWLAARGTAAGTPGWLCTSAADAYACDAAITPVVTGTIDPEALDQLIVALAAALPARCGCGGCTRPLSGLARPADIPGTPDTAGATDPVGARGSPAGQPGRACPCGGTCADCWIATLTGKDRKKIQGLILAAAADVLSGPAGLAAQLRTQLAGTRLDLPSLPLDIGQADKIPAYLRRMVAVRHPHCAFPGCARPSRRCQVHHLIPRSRGGPTALHNLVPLCSFHRLIAIHRWGWKLVLNPDGTTTATSPDRSKVLHSHGPPGTIAA